MSRAVWRGEDVVVLSFIGANKVLGMSKMGKGFPGVFRWGIAFPTDTELSVGGRAPMGDDGFDGAFFLSADDRWRRR